MLSYMLFHSLIGMHTSDCPVVVPVFVFVLFVVLLLLVFVLFLPPLCAKQSAAKNIADDMKPIVNVLNNLFFFIRDADLGWLNLDDLVINDRADL